MCTYAFLNYWKERQFFRSQPSEYLSSMGYKKATTNPNFYFYFETNFEKQNVLEKIIRRFIPSRPQNCTQFV